MLSLLRSARQAFLYLEDVAVSPGKYTVIVEVIRQPLSAKADSLHFQVS